MPSGNQWDFIVSPGVGGVLWRSGIVVDAETVKLVYAEYLQPQMWSLDWKPQLFSGLPIARIEPT